MSDSNFNEDGFINHPKAIRSDSVRKLISAEIAEIDKLLYDLGIVSCSPFLEGCILFNKIAYLSLKEIGYISNKFEEARKMISST